MTIEMMNKLPFKNLKHDEQAIINELEALESNTESMFTNKKIYAKYKTGNHFLANLQDDLCIDDLNNPYFKKFTEGLSIGYTSKAILLSLDKDSSIRELRTKIKHLEDYKSEESETLINFTNQLIEFINQKKYANMIPFKALSKELGITKNQAKNYAMIRHFLIISKA